MNIAKFLQTPIQLRTSARDFNHFLWLLSDLIKVTDKDTREHVNVSSSIDFISDRDIFSPVKHLRWSYLRK